MTTAKVALPPKLLPVFVGEADVRGAYGGRGSGKTRSFAKMAAVKAYMWATAGRNGQVLCVRQFLKTLADSSLEEIKQAILEEPWLAGHFDIGQTYVRTKGLPGEVYFTFMGLDRNIDSVKSQSRILLCWADEAEPVTDEAWTKLIPTLREEDSELWVTWNPQSKRSATNKRFRNSGDERYKIVEVNWRDNPKFPAILERQRQRDLKERPEQYDHIWEGGFATALEGAYYATALHEAKEQDRIGFFAQDPLMPVYAFFDIGGTGRKADATAIWIAQFIGGEIRVLDYYEARHQPLSVHLAWMRKRGWNERRTMIWLPHDGDHGEKVFDTDYRSACEAAGFDADIVPNQGRGAAMERVDAARRLFPRIRFNAETTEAGREALGFYHEKQDEERDIGLGPDHDWSSHGADAFGMMCIVYEDNPPTRTLPQIGDEFQASI